ncbi:MAG: Mov34/MPN/PAD-1 family protein [Thermodesulfobacteriota bacterium]
MFLGIGKKKKNSLAISRDIYDQIVEHAKEAYPNECCGILIGSYMKGKKVLYVHRAENTNTERAKDRYIISPTEIYLIDREARSQSLDIVGFYHSHPDHPSEPSQTDREWGQPKYSYIIVSVKNGTEVAARCWTFEDEDAPFKEEKLNILG